MFVNFVTNVTTTPESKLRYAMNYKFGLSGRIGPSKDFVGSAVRKFCVGNGGEI